MFKFLDDFIDKLIDKIKIWWNSGKQSVYDFVSKYENLEQYDNLKRKTVYKTEPIHSESNNDKIADEYDLKYYIKPVKRTDNNRDNVNTVEPDDYSRWRKNICYSEPHYLCSCASYNPKTIMRIKSSRKDSSIIISNGKETKKFYRKRYKSDENFEKAILNFQNKTLEIKPLKNTKSY